MVEIKLWCSLSYNSILRLYPGFRIVSQIMKIFHYWVNYPSALLSLNHYMIISKSLFIFHLHQTKQYRISNIDNKHKSSHFLFITDMMTCFSDCKSTKTRLQLGMISGCLSPPDWRGRNRCCLRKDILGDIQTCCGGCYCHNPGLCCNSTPSGRQLTLQQ